jgi:cellulose synthase/poly-beta-1,6-N-acetylglucosamine synthase-like glycosyltransferase
MAANETVRRESENHRLVVSVIIPARNEEASLGTCLGSLVSQTGVDFEIIVVDDHSTDRTDVIASSFTGVRLVKAGPLPPGHTGKNNAVITGVHHARGEWLLFTDADTVHLPGSLARSLAEAREYQVDMLSYSPEQIAVTFWEMAVLPVVFAELARQYPPSKVSDPNSRVAAANGQYILAKREAYDAVGGHAAVAAEILEDVALARRFKAAGKKIRFRYAADAVRTRMYRNWPQLRDGWTKNLTLLFPHPRELAIQQFGIFAVTIGLGWMVLRTLINGKVRLFFSMSPAVLTGASFLCLVFYLIRFLRRAHFPRRANLLAVFGLPVFGYLLLRSKRAHAKGSVRWKGRTYAEKLATGH